MEFEKPKYPIVDCRMGNHTYCHTKVNNDLLQSLIELVDKIRYFPGELSKDHYAVKRAEKLIDNTK